MHPSPDASPAEADAQLARLAKAFESSQGEGLFLLAAERFNAPPAPAFSYWRDFAAAYLTALCHTPDVAGLELAAIPPPTSGELATLILSVPPMQGAEYLSEATLLGAWNDLDEWTRGAIAAGGEGLTGFLNRRAPLWHQVGRVCFHLAENRRNEEYPFAFMATYAPSVATGGRVKYQLLGLALNESVGTRNNKVLQRLLAPVEAAEQRSELVKELLDSGDIFQSLVWKPGQAYQFLKDVPVMEESGILVRMPDWWKKRPRPRVSVTIGDAGRKKFDMDSMLDFKVQLALGDQQLSEAEWRELMAANEGLVMLRGQWVEVNREKLQQALDHWKQVEEQARMASRSWRACGCWRAFPPIWARCPRRGRPPMVVRTRRPVAGRCPGQDAQPGKPATGRHGRGPESHFAAVPGDGSQLAAVLVQPGAGGLPGRRHGAGQDDPSPGVAAGLKRPEGGQTLAPGAARLAVGQLEGGDGPLHALAAGRIPARGGNGQRRTRPDCGKSRAADWPAWTSW